MNYFLRYINLGTEKLTDKNKIETVRLFNTLALVGGLIHLLIFFIFFSINLTSLGYLNLFFLTWLTFIPILNYHQRFKVAVFAGNALFAPMVIALSIVYGGAHHIEDFIFIGFALTFFSYTKARYLLFFTTINFLAYLFVVAARIYNWIAPMPESLLAFDPVFQAINIFSILVAMSTILYSINRHYRNLSKDLKDSAQQLKLKTLVVEQSLEEVRKANATKLKLLKVISHDLRGPFTGLLGLTELMEKQYERYDKDEMKEMLRLLSDSSKNTLILIENLVQWSKLQSDGMLMERKNLRLSSVIKQIFRIYNNMAVQKTIRLINEVDDMLMVNADENMLMIIVRNLVNNALKFTPDGGEIRISATPKRRYVRIDISDTGVGMTPVQINAILQNGENSSIAGTMGEKGSGLGLLLCKEFIEKHHCRMYINSNKNEGTIVTFTLPAAKPETNTHPLIS
jgi:signal transduction histidine kinase